MPHPSEDARFHTTRWTLVNDSQGSGIEADRALKELCQIYWSPLYAYARRSGLKPHDAEDAIQSFFVTALRRRLFNKADRSRGKLRSFLLTALKHHFADLASKSSAAKRQPVGGSVAFIDIATVEERLAQNETASQNPQSIYDIEWAHSVLAEALRQLESRYAAENQSILFNALRPHLGGGETPEKYSEIAATLAMKPSAVGVALHRLRKRYREAMRATICETVECEDEAEAEFQELARILTDSKR